MLLSGGLRYVSHKLEGIHVENIERYVILYSLLILL